MKAMSEKHTRTLIHACQKHASDEKDENGFQYWINRRDVHIRRLSELLREKKNDRKSN